MTLWDQNIILGDLPELQSSGILLLQEVYDYLGWQMTCINAKYHHYRHLPRIALRRTCLGL